MSTIKYVILFYTFTIKIIKHYTGPLYETKIANKNQTLSIIYRFE